MTEKLDLPQ